MAAVHVVRSVFLDTSEYERLSFAFGDPLLTALANHGRQGNISLLIPSVTAREVESRIRCRVEEACENFRKARQKGYVLRKSASPDVSGLFAEPSVNVVVNEMVDQFHRWVGSACAVRLDPPPDALETVLDAYFAKAPPFGEGPKQWEFHDAVTLSCLRAAKAVSRPVIVFSQDGDWKKVCESDDSFVLGDRLEHTLSEVTTRAQELRESVSNALEHHWDEIDDWAKDLARDLVIRAGNNDCADVEHVEIVETECQMQEIVDVQGGVVIVGLDVAVVFNAGVSVGHPADPEAYQTWVSKEEVQVPATLEIRVDSGDPLANARLAFDSDQIEFDLFS